MFGKKKIISKTGREIETYGAKPHHSKFWGNVKKGALVVGKTIGKGAAAAGRYEKAHIKGQIRTVKEYAGNMADNIQAAEQQHKKNIKPYSPPPVSLKWRRV